MVSTKSLPAHPYGSDGQKPPKGAPSSKQFLHALLSKEDANVLLKSAQVDGETCAPDESLTRIFLGAFLVREERSGRGYILSAIFGGQVISIERTTNNSCSPSTFRLYMTFANSTLEKIRA